MATEENSTSTMLSATEELSKLFSNYVEFLKSLKLQESAREMATEENSTSTMLSATEELSKLFSNYVEFPKSLKLQESAHESEHLNMNQEMNCGLESAMESLHVARAHAHDVIPSKALNARQVFERAHIKKTKHASLDKTLKKVKLQGTELNTQDIKLHEELNMIKQAFQERDSKIKELENLIKSLTWNHVNDMEGKIERMQQTMDAFTNRITSLEERDHHDKTSLDDQASPVGSTDVKLATLLLEREQEADQLKELEGRVIEAETSRRKDWNFYQQKLNDVENLYKQVCEMVAGQVQPLRRLQNMLNKSLVVAEKRQLLTEQMDSVNATVTALESRVSSLESSGRHATVGFTAYLPHVTKMAASSIMKEFSDIACNEGNCYNPVTGLFKAPTDGLYCTSVTLRQRKEGHIDVNVMVMRPELGEMRAVMKSATHSDKKCSTAVGVVKLKAGDFLFARSVTVVPEVSLSQYSSFTCYLIG